MGSPLDRALAALENRQKVVVRNLIARGEVSATSVAKMQGLQATLFAGEIKDGIEHFEPAGFTSHPLPGSEPVVLFPGGDRSHGIAVVVADRRTRPTDLPAGGACVYCPADGIARINLLPGGKVEIIGTEVVIKASQRFKWDVNGHGQDWRPTYVDTWTIGETAGTAHPITSPEYP